MTNDQFQRAGAKLQADGQWLCRLCGLPVESDMMLEEHGAVTLFDLNHEVIEVCGQRIGKVIDMIALSERRRLWILAKTDESFALPEYLRQGASKAMRLTAKPTIKLTSLWYTEIRDTIQHSIETCPKRPPLEKRYEKSLQSGLQRSRWT